LGLSAEVALVPASGGGLASGVAIALGPATRVWAVEPEGHDDLARSLAGGAIVANAPGIRSICDALMVEKTGAFTFSAAQAHLAGAFAVSDASVRRAMRFAFDELKLVLEPGGAIALAAALERRLGARDGVIAVVASGGNVDAETFAAVLA
jgi:threonine dehydratase